MTTTAPNAPPPEREPRRRGAAWGALLVAAFTIAFLWGPITRTDEVMVPAHLAQQSSLTRVDKSLSGDDPAAMAAYDTWSTWVPNVLFSRSEIAAGRLPTWNGLSGPGAPHLADLSTAVFSPFSAPWYVLEPRNAALVSSFARLFLLGFFTFLFLRELRLGFAASVAGAIVFEFAGANVVNLFNPTSAAAVLLPAGLFLVERMMRSTERALVAGPGTSVGSGASWGTAAGLAIAIAVGFFAGHFETFCFASILVLAWALARFAHIGQRERWTKDARRELGRTSLRILVALVVAASIAGIQLLPWREHVRTEGRPGGMSAFFVPHDWTLQAFPDLLGGPTAAFQGIGGFAHRGLLSGYVGALALFLALSALVLVRRRRATWFFAVAGATWLAHRPVREAQLDLSPWAANVALWTGPLAFAISIAVLAALALDHVVSERRTASARLALVLLVCGTAFTWIFRENAAALADEAMGWAISRSELDASDDPLPFHELASRAHVDLMSAMFFAGLLCVVVAIAMRPSAWRSVLVLATALAAFAQTGWLMRASHPTAPERMLYPRTEAVEKLAKATEGKTFFVLDKSWLAPIPPSTHLPLGLRQLAMGDRKSAQRSAHLSRTMLASRTDRPKALERGLQILGAELVLEQNRWDDAEMSTDAARVGAPFPSGEILPGAEFVQHFVDRRAQSTPFGFQWITPGARNECTFTVTIEDAQTGDVYVRKVFAPGDLRPRGQKQMPCSIEFPEEKRKWGRKLVMRIASDDAVSGRAWRVLCKTRRAEETDSHAADWRAEQGSKRVDGQLALQPDDDASTFLFEEQIASYALRRCPGASRFRTVGRAVRSAPGDDALAVLARPAFDPRTMVVVETTDEQVVRAQPISDETTRPEILSETNTEVKLQADRASPGWLVASIAWYPGWRARVNGAEVPLYCANYAFTALALPAGANVVELEFRPGSVRNGARMSGVGLLGLACMLGAAFVARRRRSRA
jgi:hypothetical protein